MKKKILIIEDEQSIAELQRDYLEFDGFEVDIEERGDTGLKRALSDTPDLIILDLMLPHTDGFEICRRVRSEKNTPILMVSARKEDIDKIRGLGLGADDYVIKPFSPGELVARVKAHIARYERLVGTHSEKKDEIRVHGLYIDKLTRQVTVNETEVFLTSREYDLLVHLSTHPNRVFTKDGLFERIWGHDSMSDSTAVTVYVRKLREKIEVDPSNPQYIETIWGVGYRFRV